MEMQSMKKTFFLIFTKFSFKIGFSLEHIYFNFFVSMIKSQCRMMILQPCMINRLLITYTELK